MQFITFFLFTLVVSFAVFGLRLCVGVSVVGVWVWVWGVRSVIRLFESFVWVENGVPMCY